VGGLALSKPRFIAVPLRAASPRAFLFLQTTRLGKAIRGHVAEPRGRPGVRHRRAAHPPARRSGWPARWPPAAARCWRVIVAIQPEMGGVCTFKSFLVIVLGGAGNYPGALLGGLLLGLVEQLASLFLTTQLSEVVAYVLLVLVLLMRPTGSWRPPVVRLSRGRSSSGLAVLAGRAGPLPDGRHRLRRSRHAAGFMWIALAGSWNLISGLTGYVSFGHVAFFGAGAYTGAILVATAGWPWPAAAAAGGAAACVLALLTGYPCLRLKGPYFAIAMLGLNEVLRALVSYFEGLTGGGNGLSLPTLDATRSIYYVMGGLAIAVTAMTYMIITSRFGPAADDDPRGRDRRRGDGHRHLPPQADAFLLSGGGPGVAGALTRAIRATSSRSACSRWW
jgi:ABC-type branched-subunit amino acid transport system permease subunit